MFLKITLDYIENDIMSNVKLKELYLPSPISKLHININDILCIFPYSDDDEIDVKMSNCVIQHREYGRLIPIEKYGDIINKIPSL